MNMTDKKIAVITGANRGIGLAMTTLFSQKGYQVYALCGKSNQELFQHLSSSILKNYRLQMFIT